MTRTFGSSPGEGGDFSSFAFQSWCRLWLNQANAIFRAWMTSEAAGSSVTVSVGSLSAIQLHNSTLSSCLSPTFLALFESLHASLFSN